MHNQYILLQLNRLFFLHHSPLEYPRACQLFNLRCSLVVILPNLLDNQLRALRVPPVSQAQNRAIIIPRLDTPHRNRPLAHRNINLPSLHRNLRNVSSLSFLRVRRVIRLRSLQELPELRCCSWCVRFALPFYGVDESQRKIKQKLQ